MLDLSKLLDRYLSRNHPFRVLCRVFLLRVVDLELLSSDADTTKLLSQFAAMFASASFLCTAPIILLSMQFHLPDDLPPEMLRTMQHLFFATTMLVVGLIATLSWESIFPGRQDLLILAPLPVRLPTLFSSKISALAAAVGLAGLSLNCFTGIFWPLLFAAPASGLIGLSRAFCAYWITVTAAALFAFCFVLTIHGVASLLLSRQAFLRASSWIQLGGFCLLIGGYILEPSLEANSVLLAPHNHTLLACLPAYWFLGLFQQLNGSMQPVFAPLAKEAWLAIALSIGGAFTSVLVAYFTTRRIVEQPDILPASHRRRHALRLGAPLTSAILSFTARGLTRSRQHRVLFALYAAIGLTTLIICLHTPWTQFSGRPLGGHAESPFLAPFLEASYVMMIFPIVGARVVFALPVSLRANWVFRITEVRSNQTYRTAVRKSMMVLTVLPVVFVFAAASALMCTCHWLPKPAMLHVLVLVLLGAILVELALARFPKLPFTASYLPGKANIHMFVWGALIALIPAASLAAGCEVRILSSFGQSGAMLTGLIALLAGIHSLADASCKNLQFEENNEEYIISLRLSP